MAKEAQSEQARISACNALLDRAYGRSQASQPIELDLPELCTVEGIIQSLTTILRATASGKLTPAEAHSLSSVIEMQRKAIETAELEDGGPELAWQRDVLQAVRSKSQDLDNYQDPLPENVLLVYSNSNAASLIHDAMWPSVFSGCNPMNEQLWKQAPSRLKGIALICGPWLMVLRPDRIQTYPLRFGLDENT